MEENQDKDRTMIVRGIYTTAKSSVIHRSELESDIPQLPIFDESKLFWLEVLGEGGSGSVHKAYDKHDAQFIAIKKFTDQKMSKEKKWEEIMVEDYMLQSIEKIRSNKLENEQYFLKYYGVFRNLQDPDSFILQMENGRVSLEEILKAGKRYTCAELIYVHRKLAEGFAILQENGIANRDVKPGNIILVENPISEGSFHYKISDYGISCKLEKGIFTSPVLGILGLTKQFAAPEILSYFERGSDEIPESEVYNPFLADVYSFGVLTLKMINNNWNRKHINSEDFLNSNNFPGYEPILELLAGMLQEDPQNRWDFKKIRKYYQEKENDAKFQCHIPSDEGEYIHKYFIEFKEKKMEKTFENLLKLYKEHANMHVAYFQKVTRPKDAKFHLDRSWDALQKTFDKFPENGDRNFLSSLLSINTVKCLIQYGDWYFMLGDLKAAEENFINAKRKNEELQLEYQFNQIKFEVGNFITTEYEAYILGRLGELYENMGDILKAEEMCLQSLNLHQSHIGENNNAAAGCLNKLGKLNQNFGRLIKSKKFYIKALAIQRNLSRDEENISKISTIVNNLGMLYQMMGNLPKAKKYLEKSLEIGQNLFGESHSTVASTMNNLGTVYFVIGDFTKAEELYLKSLKIRQEIFGENHSFVATSINNLGSVYLKMGKLLKAEDFFLKSLKIELKLFGENHKDVLTTMSDLGTLYLAMNNFPKSTEFFMKSMRITQNIFGENHSAGFLLLNNIGMLYEKMGSLEKAKNFVLKSLNIAKNLSNENYFFMRDIINNLASIYGKKGKFLKAEKFYLKCMRMSQSKFGEIHLDVADSYFELGSHYFRCKVLNKSEDFYLKSLKIYQNLSAENYSNVIDMLNTLGSIYKNKGNLSKSTKFYLKSLNLGRNIYGENHEYVAIAMNNLSQVFELCKSRNKKRIALVYSEKAFLIFNILLGPNNQITIKMFQHYQQLLNLNAAISFWN